MCFFVYIRFILLGHTSGLLLLHILLWYGLAIVKRTLTTREDIDLIWFVKFLFLSSPGKHRIACAFHKSAVW
jgi:hypothetical protein